MSSRASKETKNNNKKRENFDYGLKLFFKIFQYLCIICFLIVGAYICTVIIETILVIFDVRSVDYLYQSIRLEIGYLGFHDNFVGVKPTDVAKNLINYINRVSAAQYLTSIKGSQALIVFGTILYNSLILVSLKTLTGILTLPVYLFIFVVAVADGLIARDLRKINIEKESSMKHHLYLRWIQPSLWAPITLYVGLPFSWHPLWFFAPGWICFFFSVYFAVKYFKKHL